MNWKSQLVLSCLDRAGGHRHNPRFRSITSMSMTAICAPWLALDAEAALAAVVASQVSAKAIIQSFRGATQVSSGEQDVRQQQFRLPAAVSS